MVPLAGCTGGDSGSDGAATTGTATATTGTATSTEADATVRVASHDEHGDVLVDGEGMTLYMFESDTKGDGSSACDGACVDPWPPLTGDEPAAGDGVTASLTTFERDDGSMHVAANGWPLYYFASDDAPGDAMGHGVDGFGGRWWVLDPAGNPRRADSDSGGATTTTEDGGPGY